MKLSRNIQGFGLVELVIVIAMIAILVALAAPNYTVVAQNNTLTESANRFISSMAIARNEAATRNRFVTMCQLNATNNGCNNNGLWENGWTVWADTDERILTESPLPANFTLRASNNQFTNSITYNAQGNAVGDGGNGVEIFRLCEPTANITISKAINLNGIGRAWVNSTPGTVACP